MANDLAKARKSLRAARTIRRNLRLQRYQGRNSASTEATLEWREREGMEIAQRLPRHLCGLVVAEHHLAERLSLARDIGQDRPELRERMNRLRREIRST